MEELYVEIVNPEDNKFLQIINYFVCGPISMVVSNGFENKKIASFLHYIQFFRVSFGRQQECKTQCFLLGVHNFSLGLFIQLFWFWGVGKWGCFYLCVFVCMFIFLFCFGALSISIINRGCQDNFSPEVQPVLVTQKNTSCCCEGILPSRSKLKQDRYLELGSMV